MKTFIVEWQDELSDTRPVRRVSTGIDAAIADIRDLLRHEEAEDADCDEPIDAFEGLTKEVGDLKTWLNRLSGDDCFACIDGILKVGTAD